VSQVSGAHLCGFEPGPHTSKLQRWRFNRLRIELHTSRTRGRHLTTCAIWLVSLRVEV